LGLVKKAKDKLANEKNNTDGEITKTQRPVIAAADHSLSLNDMVKYSLDHFAAIKGAKTDYDEYGFSGSTYTTTNCLEGADKCVLRSSFDATLKIRIGAEKVSWEEAQKIFNEWKPKIMAITEWGKTAEIYNTDAYKTLKTDFAADRNLDASEKYKRVTIELRAHYISEDEFQVVITINN
jgi:hypothetical protein